MALNPTPVADAIATIVKNAAPPAGTPIDDTGLKSMWEAIITALYNDIKANAVVTATVAVASVSLVTVGTAASGPGTGTATGTIS